MRNSRIVAGAIERAEADENLAVCFVVAAKFGEDALPCGVNLALLGERGGDGLRERRESRLSFVEQNELRRDPDAPCAARRFAAILASACKVAIAAVAAAACAAASSRARTRAERFSASIFGSREPVTRAQAARAAECSESSAARAARAGSTESMTDCKRSIRVAPRQRPQGRRPCFEGVAQPGACRIQMLRKFGMFTFACLSFWERRGGGPLSSLPVRSAAGLAHDPINRGLGGGLEGGHVSEPGIMQSAPDACSSA